MFPPRNTRAKRALRPFGFMPEALEHAVFKISYSNDDVVPFPFVPVTPIIGHGQCSKKYFVRLVSFSRTPSNSPFKKGIPGLLKIASNFFSPFKYPAPVCTVTFSGTPSSFFATSHTVTYSPRATKYAAN